MKNSLRKKAAATLFLAVSLTTVAEAAGFEMDDQTGSVLLISALCLVLLGYSYVKHVENLKLKRELAKYKIKVKEIIREKDQQYEPIKAGDGQTVEKKEEKEGIREQYTKRLYWDRLTSTINKVTLPAVDEITELERRKKDLEEVIEITKRKYQRRELDEKSFGEIIKDQQKQMIEIEATINRLKEGEK